MINKKMYQRGNEPSAIRELFAYGLARKAELGADKVFDFSLGNPSVPTPPAVTQALVDILGESTAELHGYSPAPGAFGVRSAIADSLNRRFDQSYAADNLYMTCGAAASINITLTALMNPADEVIVIAPYFPEYKIWIEGVQARCVEVCARADNFQLDIAALGRAITSQTRGIIIDSPNNPVGVVYSRETLQALADLLEQRQKLYDHPIYLISDEPYREIAYDGIEVPWVPSLYRNTIVCYSYSKSLSLPGERIGYILVSDEVSDSREVYTAIAGAGRVLGFICAPVLFQRAIERCVDVPSDVGAYAENRTLLTEGLARLGYEYVEPQGAFYLWVRALEPDAQAFSDRAKAHELLLVPSNSFGVEGWVRIGYCVSRETIEGALPAFAQLAAEYRVAPQA
ncbi:MAG: pyridoxal phosphate-dependent aminotransferase [Raoultibacter sp.]